MYVTTRDQQGPASRDAALLQLLTGLRGAGYSFVTPTPATHARVLARPDRAIARTTRDIFGWSLPFDRDAIPAALLSLMTDAGIVEDEGALCRSTVRVSSLGPDLYLHSAYPTESRDAVFFGPDSYRFARLITSELQTMPPPAGAHVVDMGTGSGVGVIVAAHLCSKPSLTITDINPQALRFAEINLASAGFAATAVLGSTLESIVDPIDLALANPPFMVDESVRDYRDGGGHHGSGISLSMARMAAARLAPGGRFILYTGSAFVDGEDHLARELHAVAADAGCSLRYEEIDPDVFGEELENPAYAKVERIAAIAAVMRRPSA